MRINITENQYKKLTEAALPGFRLDVLRSSGSYQKRVNYCREMLGKPIGNGTSRTVFQIDDYSCLKLAKNNAGLAQNLREIEMGNEPYLSCFPKVLNGTDERNGLWIVSEFVLPLLKKGAEFEEVLGIPFSEIDKFIFVVMSCGRRGYNERYEKMKNDMYAKYESNDEVIQLFNDLYELYYSYDHSIRDLRDYNNWGLTLRDGQPTFVILDAGLSDEVDRQYYSRFR